MLTHLAPGLTGDDALSRAAALYDGPITLARTNSTINI
jgi:hypothetical protein